MAYSARYANGTLGYVADPTALRQGAASFLNELVDNDTRFADQSYWKLLMDFETVYRNGTFSGNELLSPDFICAPGPGRGYEQDYGYKLLTEKIRIHPSGSPTESSPKLLCLVYTYPKMRDLQRTQALSWGLKCDGYLAFSTETISNLGTLHLEHAGDESYDNMWQKVRSIWFYVYKHYRNDYDFFHLGGDDLYVIVENLRKFLSETLKRHAHGDEIYLGQWIPQPGDKPHYVSGGPGYTLNRAALVRLVEDALPTCRVHMRASYEDRLVSQCLGEIGIMGGDTRDRETGEQLYHDCGPAHLYTFRSTTTKRGSFHAKAASYWETLSFPNSTKKVGPKHGLDAAGKYSVTFHDIYHPLYVARLHSILYPATCPATSPLGRGLYAHSRI
jgi:glycoprotein-N-acetylgalactosamine 3-beta-galactosyltransferase